MKILWHHLPRHPLASAAVGVRSGWRHEPPQLQGVAHFLEHVHYLGSIRYPDVDAETARYGVEINGPTLAEGTIFSFTSLKEDLPYLLRVLLDMVYHPCLEAEAVEREREVILGSVGDESSYTPWEWARLKADDLLFQADELSSLGNPETITQIQLKDLRAWQRRFYHAENSFLVVAGDLGKLQTPQIEEVIAEADIPPMGERPKVIYHEQGTRFYHRPDELAHPELYVAFRFPLRIAKDLLLLEILRILLGNSPYSLLWRLRQDNPVAYMVESGVRILSDRGRFGIYVGIVDNDHVARAWDRLTELLSKLKEEEVSEEKLSWAKRVYRLELHRQFADPERAAAFLWRWALWGEEFPWFETLEDGLEGITARQIQGLAEELFRADNCFTSLVGPSGGWQPGEGLACLA